MLKGYVSERAQQQQQDMPRLPRMSTQIQVKKKKKGLPPDECTSFEVEAADRQERIS